MMLAFSKSSSAKMNTKWFSDINLVNVMNLSEIVFNIYIFRLPVTDRFLYMATTFD